ncbi:hypothetical protein KCU79_g10407, partial [Aureobasidium melanogenum]
HFTHDMLGIMGTGYPGFDVQNANALLALGQKPPGVEPSSVMPVGDGSGVPLPLIGDGLWPMTTYGPVSSSAGY